MGRHYYSREMSGYGNMVRYKETDGKIIQIEQGKNWTS